jgi:cytochrome c-type biogenesis protein CcmH/NrfG
VLLDRKRINRWAKWMALTLAIVFAISFVALGVGSGTSGMNWSALWSSISGKKTQTTAASSSDAQIKALQATLATDPNNVDALLGLAKQYESLQQRTQAAQYLERAAALQPTNKDIFLRLGNIYLNTNSLNYTSAVRVMNAYTQIAPTDPQGFLMLGVAQRGVGNSKLAILAWNKYLELAPNGDMAATVKSQIDQMKVTTTVPADASTTTTTG